MDEGRASKPFPLARVPSEMAARKAFKSPPSFSAMPLTESEVEATDEIHPILSKMEHGKFYRVSELYELTYGKELYLDLAENDDHNTLWLFVAKVLNLRTYLEVLVILERLKTGRRKGTNETEVDVGGHKLLSGPVVYYARR